MIPPILRNLRTKNGAITDFINQRVQISKEIENAIIAHSQRRELPKGHLLLKEGLTAHHLFFIARGSARTFYYHADKDITSWIYPEGLLLTSWSSFFMRTPAYEYIELLENSTITSISFDDLQKLYRDYPSLEKFGRIMVEEQLAYLDYFYKGFMFMTAKEKYDLLLSTFPDVTQRINLGHIASFLGISQETLSRIRKKK